MSALISDLRSAIRALAAARGFSAVAIITLGIGLALCVTVLTLINAYLIRALPYPAADRLYRVDYAVPGQNSPPGMARLEWSSLDDVLEFQVAWDLDVFYFLGGEYPESVPGAWVTPGFMRGLGVRPTLGRQFEVADYQTGRPPVALISHRIWQSRFGGDGNVLGQRFQAYVSDRPDEAETFTVIGVLPADFWHLNAYTDVLAPLTAPSYPYMARLRSGVPPAVAQDRITALVRGGIGSLPDPWHAVVTSAQASYVAAVRPMLWAVGAAAGLVLLIAAANVAVLLLVRGRRRQKELAVRLALGASHTRLARLLAFEALVLGLAATSVGIVSSRLAMRWLPPLVERYLERRAPGGVEAFAFDLPVLAAASACGLVITLVFALVPLATFWKGSGALNLSSAGRGTTDGKGSRRTRSMLIGVEVAASLTLLTGAALMAETAVRMLHVDFGIQAENVVTASLALRQRSYPDAPSRAAFYERLSSQVAHLGGATSAALGDWWPLQAARPRRVNTSDATPTVGAANVFAVTGEYFRTLGMTLGDGRTFTAEDRIGAGPVAVVSQSLARRLWPHGGAIGQSLIVHTDDGQDIPTTHQVVGVVNDVRQAHTDQDLFDVYVPLAQQAGRFAFLYVRGSRSSTWESDLRAAVAALDREVALGTPRSLQAGLDQQRAKPRFLALLLTVFAGFACVLALVGMHGVIAYAVRQRQREIAVRIAVGANPQSVTRLFLRQGSAVLAGGMLAGLGGAIVLGRVLQSQLHGVQPAEPRVLAVAALTFAACGLLAIWWPAWRASMTDPVLVLKEE